MSHPEGDFHDLLRREWLLTNGLGGYASGTISGHVSRRYHGLLIASLPAPLGRVVVFNHLAEHICTPDHSRLQIGGEEPGANEDGDRPQRHFLREFRLENQVPVWRYDVDGLILEKRVILLNGQNTVHVTYSLLEAKHEVTLQLQPSLHFRPHEHNVGEPLEDHYVLNIRGQHYEVSAGDDYPPLRFLMHGEEATLTHEGGQHREIVYQHEADRGYHSRGMLWSPGYFSVTLCPKRSATLVASTESWSTVHALSPDEAYASDTERRRRLVAIAPAVVQDGPAAELVLAADQFIISPAGRVEDAARARASGDEVRSVIAGYHWFTDWGRDTMISLEGLTLSTGRHAEAGWILRTFAHYIKKGLIPNYFPDGQNEGVYHTADATLWFFHALDRYVETTNDRATLSLLLPKLEDVIAHHLRGTSYGIAVDQTDGLLRQGAEGYQLTWMDAKVDDWVVTPRRGKAVEINALWYNALRLTENWVRQERGDEAAAPYAEHANRCRESFNRRFWWADGNHLYDIVDGEEGDDSACRPNQVFAISLRHPVLDDTHWSAVLDTVRDRLLTPVGLRSLARGHPDYKSRYFGDLRARDAAYHQGTVWGWLIGPFVDAWLKVHPDDKAGARRWLERMLPHLDHACVGTISEVFDAEEPFTARGCIAQAWSVAEVLRCWIKTAD
jgi:predicted glycogen debranching enzyme